MTISTIRNPYFASALAAAVMLAAPLVPAGLGPETATIGAAFARHGADDGPNDDGHHAGGDDHGRHHRGGHGRDDRREDHRGRHHEHGPNHT